MNRLMEKDNNHIGGYCPIKYDIVGKAEIFEKLGKLEDVEEMCEKISKQPIYKKYLNTVCEENYTSLHIAYNFSTKQIEVFGYECEDALSVDKYGIEWAFSKEELI